MPKKHVGIPGLNPPDKKCDDPLCPWHGTLPVRGQVLEVTVEDVKMNRAAVVVHEYLYYNKKYKRYERRQTKKHVRVPECIEVKPGDRVIIGETRPLAKSISYVVLAKVQR
ncbi:MAG: 30S ribosomal protein S17 [Infirmifilum sp.]|jgi:small subunit ribosomal protein S17|uniref:Small ribosomal subunit protein uS17 n=1 Tax=Infirmifilum uzonense TaxID=1550241 RepID=A0A0F7FJB6_9CREN|nr:30S ribosomal protein S17 [Infirmifilum uzonense]AKG39103.1 30S ribosomal protein S17 [Infirmifilum uzonense]